MARKIPSESTFRSDCSHRLWRWEQSDRVLGTKFLAINRFHRAAQGRWGHPVSGIGGVQREVSYFLYVRGLSDALACSIIQALSG